MPTGKQVDLKNATVTFTDAAGTPNTLAITIAEGTLTVNVSDPVEFTLDRGKIGSGTVRKSDEVPVEFEIASIFQSFTASSGDPVTPLQFIERRGGAAAFVSTGASCDPYCIDITVVVDNSDCSTTTEDETYTLPKCYFETKNMDFGAGTLTLSGRCKSATISSARS